MNRKVVFLSMDSLENFECYDNLLIEPLNLSGWDVEIISWRKENVNWNEFDAVIVRSTWDYQSDPQKFISVLEDIDNSKAVLFNDISTIKWNMNKNYLQDLANNGVLIVETIWNKDFNPKTLESSFELLNCDEIIIKPNISANADNTFKISKDELQKLFNELNEIFSDREFMIQPFMKSVLIEGEYSLFYFNGKLSHSILKKPKEKDFRVQEEHGGIIKSIIPAEEQIKAAEKIIGNLNPIPLYARVDIVRTDDNRFALMELELIEPSLYFNFDVSSMQSFVDAFIKRMN